MGALWIVICAVVVGIFIVGIGGEYASSFFSSREKGVKFLGYTCAGIMGLIVAMISLLLIYIGVAEL